MRLQLQNPKISPLEHITKQKKLLLLNIFRKIHDCIDLVPIYFITFKSHICIS